MKQNCIKSFRLTLFKSPIMLCLKGRDLMNRSGTLRESESKHSTVALIK